MKIEPNIKKKMINGKERLDFILLITHKQTICFIQGDSNIWWKPRKIIKNWGDSYGRSIGWLFIQIGYIKFYKKEGV